MLGVGKGKWPGAVPSPAGRGGRDRSGRRHGGAEAEVDLTGLREAPEAEGGATERADSEPATAPGDPALGARYRQRVTARNALRVERLVVYIYILAPLPHISVHVEEAKLIGLLPTHRMGLASTIAFVPPHIVEITGAREPPRRPSPAGVLPLCLAWEPEPRGRLEVLDVVPADGSGRTSAYTGIIIRIISENTENNPTFINTILFLIVYF